MRTPLNALRIVIEIDGNRHYAADDGRAEPSRYSDMVSEDRELRLAGYKRSTALAAASSPTAREEKLRGFLDRLLNRHGLGCRFTWLRQLQRHHMLRGGARR